MFNLVTSFKSKYELMLIPSHIVVNTPFVKEEGWEKTFLEGKRQANDQKTSLQTNVTSFTMLQNNVFKTTSLSQRRKKVV